MQTSEILHVLAQAAPAPGGGNALMQFAPFILLFVAMWFLLIAPQRKRQKEHQKMLESLQPGDEVITNGGIYGTIQQVRSDRLVIKIADNTRIELAKGFVQSKVSQSSSQAQK